MEQLEIKEKTSFDYLMDLLEPKEEYMPVIPRCRRLWESFPIEQQRDIYRRINRKKKENRFLDYNPLFAIEKNATAPPEQPRFLSGLELYDAMNDHLELVQVDIPGRREGRYPICTREVAERFGLTIRRDF